MHTIKSGEIFSHLSDRKPVCYPPVDGRRVTAADPVIVPQARQGTAISAVANDVNGSDQALHAGGIPGCTSRRASPLLCATPQRDKESAVKAKSPQLTGPASHTRTSSLRASSLVKDRIRKLPR